MHLNSGVGHAHSAERLNSKHYILSVRAALEIGALQGVLI